MAITFFGVSTNPADTVQLISGLNKVVTPPASMTAGQLVVVFMCCTEDVTTYSVAVTGGQTWNTSGKYTQVSAPLISGQIFWCEFNGTWSADPQFSSTDTNDELNILMLVFTTDDVASVWAVSADQVFTARTAALSFTITGQTPTHANNVGIALWYVTDNNTWGTLTGTGWSKAGLGAQYRNSNTGLTVAYNIQGTTAVQANVAQTQSGSDAGYTAIMTFGEGVAAAPASLVYNPGAYMTPMLVR